MPDSDALGLLHGLVDLLHGPLYPRLLRLKNIELAPWHRALLVEGTLSVAAILTLADVATLWTLLVLPVSVALMVKFHDILVGALRGPAPARPAARAAEPAVIPRIVTLPPAPVPADTEEPMVRLVPAPTRSGVGAEAEPAAEAASEPEVVEAAAEVDEAVVAARTDLGTLRREARELAAELLRTDGEVGVFALALDADGEVVPLHPAAAYAAATTDARVAALRAELDRVAATDSIRAAALAVARDTGLVIDLAHRDAAGTRVRLPFSGGGLGDEVEQPGALPVVTVWR